MESEDKRFTLRIEMELFDKVKERAEKNRRSIAKEIEHILAEYLDEEERKNKKK